MQSIKMLEHWLIERGYQSEQVSLGSPEKAKFLLISHKSKPEKKLLFSAKRISYPPTTSATRDVTSDKTKTYDLAKLHSINYPEYLVIDVDSYDVSATEAFLNTQGTVVVKPYDGLQSRGVTVGVNDADALKNAILTASKVSSRILIQKQVTGQEIRIVVIERKVKAVLLRQKPQVVGDGRSNVGELIENENIDRRKIKSTTVPYPELTAELIDSSVDMNYIPAKNEVVQISKASLIRDGASVYEVMDQTDQSYIEMAEKLCSPLIGPLVCVDIMLEDYSKPADEKNYALIELNLGMSLPLCYSCRDGNQFDIIEEYIGPKVIQEFTRLQ